MWLRQIDVSATCIVDKGNSGKRYKELRYTPTNAHQKKQCIIKDYSILRPKDKRQKSVGRFRNERSAMTYENY